MAPEIADAVDHLEVAAALEAGGLSDQAAARYGYPDVFLLAEALCEVIPKQPREPEPLPVIWSAKPGTHLLRGVLFGLPGVCYTAAAGVLTDRAALGVVVISLFTSWSLGQSLSYLGYLQLGRADTDAAARVLRRGMLVGCSIVLAVSAIAALLLGSGTPALTLAVGQGWYLLSATVLLVLNNEYTLLATLAPGVLAGLTLSGGPLWIALAASVLGTGVLALRRTRTTRPRTLSKHDLIASLPYGAFGFIAAGLLVLPLFWPSGQGHSLAALPISISMGVAEWSLVVYRRRATTALRGTHLFTEFARDTRLGLLRAVAVFLTVAAALSIVVLLATGTITDPTALLRYGAYLALGGALFVALVLQACGSTGIAVAACAGALVAQLWTGDAVIGQLVVNSALLVVLGGCAAVVLSESVRHG
ncbi:hypothetical protein NLX83_19525 [Allokutzneria sp. A3M-2-11 16]|uniref:hypothetical protein n=1 Tax=Allokutzneria sp. A3M-2-11 16 TaxID=2962043 RepID=UPI0020B70D12|nr:hypothetical protein [Allokutzneria sp. A3M-2-11 16]MCP3801452.1 hypothetical protein [Allokutzneria sp. A3M-2-11 16]